MCRENDIGILPYSSLQQGLLSGKFRKLEDVPEGRRRTRLFNSQRYFEASVVRKITSPIGASEQMMMNACYTAITTA